MRKGIERKMGDIVIRGRGVISGKAEGPALVFKTSVQGNCAFDLETGEIIQKGHPLEGQNIANTIIILEGGRGSAGWSCRLHSTVVSGVGPKAMIFPKLDSRTAAASVVAGVPVVTDLDQNPFQVIETGDWLKVDGDAGVIEVNKVPK
ncbi:MAG TPA: DUF126 domain-containing protein [Synergistales bacterium]|nr:DUF126 domain-containing protein [Synergistales bacterium]